MGGLNFEKLDRPLKHCDVISEDDFVEWQIILDDELPINEHYPTAVGVERGEDVIFC